MTSSYDHKVPAVPDFVDVAADVALVADGALTEDPDAREIRLTVTGDNHETISIDIAVDLGIAGQSITIGVDRQVLAAALRDLSPLVIYSVGETLIDVEKRDTVVVRDQVGYGVYLVSPATYTGSPYRQKGALLVRPKRIEADQ